MVNVFEQVKRYIEPVQVVRHYLGDGSKKAGSYWYVSPFRREKTASFCVSNKKGIHDFGDNSHYDIISFTAKLFDLSNIDSVQKLIDDFSLPMDIGNDKPKIFQMRDYALYKQRIEREKAEKETKREYYEYLYQVSCEKYKFWRKLRENLQENRHNLEQVNLSMIYAKEDYYDSLCEEILGSSEDEVWEKHNIWKEVIL